MDDTELKRRKAELLNGERLKNEINKLFKNKGFNARCDAADNILTGTGLDKKDLTIVNLAVDVGNEKYLLNVYINIPKDIYYEDKFAKIDSYIPGRLPIDDRILLRALRVAFTVVRDIRAEAATAEIDVYHTRRITVDENGELALDR